MDKFDSFYLLSDGWDGYSAEAPKPAAIENAKSFVLLAQSQNTEPARIAASSMGGVGVTFKNGPRKVFVEFYNSGTAHSLFSDRSTEEMSTLPVPINYDGYLHVLGRIRQYLFCPV